MENEKNEKFTIRERISIKAVALLLAIVKPNQYAHEWNNFIKEMEDLMK